MGKGGFMRPRYDTEQDAAKHGTPAPRSQLMLRS